MTYATVAPSRFTARGQLRRPRRRPVQDVCNALGLACVVSAGIWMLEARSGGEQAADDAPVAPQAAKVTANVYVPLFHPSFSLGPEPVTFDRSAPVSSAFVAARAPVQVAAITLPPAPEPVVALAPGPVMAPADAVAADPALAPPPAPPALEASVPLPAPRPPELRSLATLATPRPMRRQVAQQNRTVVPQSRPSDGPSFFERLFGGASKPAGPALAYAAPGDGWFGRSQPAVMTPGPNYDRYTAIYNIAAHTVTLPDGTRLEAHSGLGDKLDDPRQVHVRMRGATPPHVYDLEPRAQLFHGVRALRLNPVGGGGVFGRTGLLAHTYMLGPNGDSNGCVSFRNYQAFLQAYANGQVKRLAVVAGL